MSNNNAEFNIGGKPFKTEVMNADADNGGAKSNDFAGVTGLNLTKFAAVTSANLGIYEPGAGTGKIQETMQHLTTAIENFSKMASYVGGIENRLTSQEELLKSQITNYNAAISRIEDADMAEQQLGLVKAQFLQSTSLTSLAQANQNPNAFMQLMR